jgi:hypothetical protein
MARKSALLRQFPVGLLGEARYTMQRPSSLILVITAAASTLKEASRGTVKKYEHEFEKL